MLLGIALGYPLAIHIASEKGPVIVDSKKNGDFLQPCLFTRGYPHILADMVVS